MACSFFLFVTSSQAQQCTASNSLQFTVCITGFTDVYVDQSYTVPDDIDLEGISIEIRTTRTLTFTGSVSIDTNTSFTGNGNASIFHAGVKVSRSPGQGEISFDELNTRLQSGLYTTLEEAVTGNVLPVQLDAFYGEWQHKTILLKWSTVMELNNDVFEIQHSVDGKNFKTIASVYGAGTIDEKQYYQIRQTADFTEGINYYRLKQIDFDGAFTFSEVIVVKVPLKENFRVRPTVVLNMLHIDFSEPTQENAWLQIVHSNGRLIMEIPLEYHTETLSMDLSDLRSGFYYIRFMEEDRASTTSFIKK